jgi:hypothetical protein
MALVVNSTNTSSSLVQHGGRDADGAGDMDGNGRDEVGPSFQDAGIWILANGSAWWQLHPVNPEDLLFIDLDGNGFADAVVDSGQSSGTWTLFNSAVWVQVHALRPEMLASGNIAP